MLMGAGNSTVLNINNNNNSESSSSSPPPIVPTTACGTYSHVPYSNCNTSIIILSNDGRIYNHSYIQDQPSLGLPLSVQLAQENYLSHLIGGGLRAYMGRGGIWKYLELLA